MMLDLIFGHVNDQVMWPVLLADVLLLLLWPCEMLVPGGEGGGGAGSCRLE